MKEKNEYVDFFTYFLHSMKLVNVSTHQNKLATTKTISTDLEINLLTFSCHCSICMCLQHVVKGRKNKHITCHRLD